MTKFNMKSSILLNPKTEIDLPKLIDSRLLVQANSGGGKLFFKSATGPHKR
jgi:hypothetical protein